MGPVGAWLSRAEALLGTEEKLNGKPDEVCCTTGKWWKVFTALLVPPVAQILALYMNMG